MFVYLHFALTQDKHFAHDLFYDNENILFQKSYQYYQTYKMRITPYVSAKRNHFATKEGKVLQFENYNQGKILKFEKSYQRLL